MMKELPPVSIDADCEMTNQHQSYAIHGEWLLLNGRLHAKLDSHDEHTQSFEATIVCDNEFLNGQKISGCY